MNHKITKILKFFLLICFFVFPLYAKDELLDLLEDELKREMNALSGEEVPPYFIGYMVIDENTYYANASFGALTNSNESIRRYLFVIVRVGDYTLDNTHEIRGDWMSQWLARRRRKISIALDQNPDALRAALWRETDEQYRQAVEIYSKVKANVAVKVEEEDKSADFSQELSIEKYSDPSMDFKKLLGDKSILEAKVKNYTEPFLKEKDIYSAQSSFSFNLIRQYIVTSEGTKIVQNHSYTRLFVSSFIKSEDGMELPLYKSYLAFKPEGLPDDQSIIADVENMIQKLQELYNAPVVEPYTGPAMLSGRAAGVFFHEIFGHRVEGHRLKQSEDAQTFKKKINEKVLPEHISVLFDPLRKQFNNKDLNGYYKYDDEGVKAQKVYVVESGILKRFLMSRSPIENFLNSNGHGRAQFGFKPVSRQSNLIVESSSLLTMADLRKKLIEECKKQNKEFGLLFEDVIGGFTFTSRWIPNAFNVIPTLVYKVYVDGKPDEIVRGVDLVGTPLLIFSNITEAGEEFGIFNGTCGAESGGIPVSAVSPALLVSQIEVQKKIKSQERPPVLERPDTETLP